MVNLRSLDPPLCHTQRGPKLKEARRSVLTLACRLPWDACKHVGGGVCRVALFLQAGAATSVAGNIRRCRPLRRAAGAAPFPAFSLAVACTKSPATLASAPIQPPPPRHPPPRTSRRQKRSSCFVVVLAPLAPSRSPAPCALSPLPPAFFFTAGLAASWPPVVSRALRLFCSSSVLLLSLPFSHYATVCATTAQNVDSSVASSA